MAAGDLITVDNQYEVNGYLIGRATVRLGESDVTGWDDATVRSTDVDRDLADGAIGGLDASSPLEILVPVLIDCASGTVARSELALLRAAWKAGGAVDVELHRQVDGAHEYVVGRTRGVTPIMTWVGSGLIPALCSFRALDPTIVSVP